jgi:hypothetical protein
VPRSGTDFGRRWRRRESNPRSQKSASDSEEDADLASAAVDEAASEVAHKEAGLDGRPFIDPGQLSVFDFLDGADSGGAQT